MSILGSVSYPDPPPPPPPPPPPQIGWLDSSTPATAKNVPQMHLHNDAYLHSQAERHGAVATHIVDLTAAAEGSRA